SLIVLAALTTVVACTDMTGLGNQTIGGTYALASVNSNGIPFTYTSGSNTITINSDIYTLQRNGTYSEIIDETVSNGYSSSPASDAESGTWTQSANAVVFYPSYSTQGSTTQYTASLTSGSTFSRSSLTFSYSGVVWIYNHT
ncbi:MAG TPA: hypothetical protein VIG47_06475, partial [Gemmatimonadaceae bacterium]